VQTYIGIMADILNVEQHQTVQEFKQNLEELIPNVGGATVSTTVDNR